MTQLQEKEYEILKIFIEICDKLGLEYYCVCGTALGAVKYGGFIPWDDDIDVGLPRKDYEIFIKEAPALLPKHIFLQNYNTDPNFPQVYSKLRNVNTTYIEKSVAKVKMCHGIYVDVFPFDGYPKKKCQQSILEHRKNLYKRLMSAGLVQNRWWKNLLMMPLRALQIQKLTPKLAKRYDDMISKYGIDDTDLWCNHGNWQGKLEYAPREQYGKGVMMKFEDLNVRIPERYDEYLTQKYGAWREDLPEELKFGHHYYEFIDFDKSYTEYMVK